MKLSKGFTLIELIVVMAVFLFVIGAAIGIFLSIIQNQKKVLAEQQLLNQISYIEEYMSKALRMAAKDKGGLTCFNNTDYTGYSYLLTGSADGFYTGIKFFNQSDNTCQEFYWDTARGILEEVKGNGSAVDLTSSNMKINFIRFSIDGTTGCLGGGSCPIGDQDPNVQSVVSSQPRITILLNISIPGETTTRTIQTTVSQRNLNTNNGQ